MLKNATLIAAALVLAACQSAPNKSEEPTHSDHDLGAVRAQADEAYAAGDWEAARPHYETLVRELPQDGAFWFRLGNVYARTERPDAAVAAYREAVVRNAADGKIWFNMGVVQLRQAANSFLKMDLHVDPGDPLAEQGKRAYTMIMEVLGEPDERAASSAAPVAAEQLQVETLPPATAPAADTAPVSSPAEIASPAAGTETMDNSNAEHETE